MSLEKTTPTTKKQTRKGKNKMPKYDGIISLYIRDLEAADDQEAAERVEDYKKLLAEHAELSWPEWDFSLTHADSEPNK